MESTTSNLNRPRPEALPGRVAPAAHWLYVLARLALGGVFVFAGTVKLADPGAFAEVVARYDMAPAVLVPWVAVGLPALEVLAGLGLILDARGSLTTISVMLVMFATVLWFGVLRGLEIDCGCFSPEELSEQDGLRQALLRDLVMMAGAAYLYFWRWLRRGDRRGRGWRITWIHP